MPIYEYKCNECGQTFSLLRFSSSKEPVKCRSCGTQDVRKIISSFSYGAASSSAAGASGGGFGGT